MTTTSITESPERVAPDFDERHIDADGFTIRYEVGGVGSPLLVIHGAGGPIRTHGLELLAESYQVHIVELPGFGDTVNDRTSSALDMARTVLALADALGFEQFDLLGTSMGGVVAAWAAAEAPDRIRHLVLEAPAAFRPDSDPSILTPEEIFSAFHAHPERKTIVPPDPEKSQRSWPLVERLVGPLYDEELAGRLRHLPVATLVMFGTRDGLFGTAPGNEYKRLLASCTFALIYDAAHDISGDRPEAFSATVSDFLRRGPEFVISNQSTVIYP